MTRDKIHMVDLQRQIDPIRLEINNAIDSVIRDTNFIQGKSVQEFELNLARWLGVKYVISCANGTDALQLALMALNLKPGDEVIVPSFTYVSTAEVIGLLGLKPILVDVYEDSFNINTLKVEALITERTKAIVPVHLFGQCANMESIMTLAKKYKLYVVEDTAQSIGAEVLFSDGSVQYAGTIGDIGTTSFFPSKNLGCFGDGGALITNNEDLAKKLKMIANHGQNIKYYHDVIGVNSRLDSIQAAVLNVKLKYLKSYNRSRQKAANYYDQALSGINGMLLPYRDNFSTHVFHQYTIRVPMTDTHCRNGLKVFLLQNQVPSMIYYPLPLHKQRAYANWIEKSNERLPISSLLSDQVLSIPMHSHLKDEELELIVDLINQYFN